MPALKKYAEIAIIAVLAVAAAKRLPYVKNWM
jgi:hypothetical protein